MSDEREGASRRDVLKASASVGALGVGAGVASAGEDEMKSTEPLEGSVQRVEPAGELHSLTTNAEDPSVLIVRDCLPWYAAANAIALEGLGEAYDVVGSAGLGSTELSGYSVVVLPSTQSSSYYSNLVDARGKLDDFVADGGTLVAHVTDDGYPCTTQWGTSFLPRGVTHVTDYGQRVNTGADHPVTDGVSDDQLDDWNFSTHGYLTNVPSDATVVMGEDGAVQSRPTYVEYERGSGQVLATMQTMEWPWQSGQGTKRLLRNELRYALNEEPADPPVDIGAAADEKLGLADRVEEASGGFVTDRSVVEPTVSNLEQGAQDGSVSKQTAAGAIDRLKVTEGLTETTFAGLVGAPRPDNDAYNIPGRELELTEEYDLVFETARSITDATVNTFFLATSYLKLPTRLFRLIPSGARSFLFSFTEGIVRKFLKTVLNGGSKNADPIVNGMLQRSAAVTSAIEDIIETGVTDGGRLLDEYDDEANAVARGLADELLQLLFTGEYTLFDERAPAPNLLIEGVSELYDPAQGGVQLQGSTEAAADAVETFRGVVKETLDRAAGLIDTFSGIAEWASIAGLFIQIQLLVLGILSGGVFLAAAFWAGVFFEALALLFNTLAVVTGVYVLDTLRVRHYQGYQYAVAGTEPEAGS